MTAHTKILPTIVGALLFATLVGGAPPSSAGPADRTHRVFAAKSDPLDVPHERWLARWEAWLQEIPVGRTPADPNSPRNCAHRRVVFIGFNGTGDDGCTVPEGKSVGLSFIAWECSTAEGNGKTYRKLRECAVQNFREFFGAKAATIRVRVDGERLTRPRRWTFTSTNRMADLPKNNIWGAPGGPTKSVTHGLFYMIKPLSPGDHEFRARVHFKGANEPNIILFRFTVQG